MGVLCSHNSTNQNVMICESFVILTNVVLNIIIYLPDITSLAVKLTYDCVLFNHLGNAF